VFGSYRRREGSERSYALRDMLIVRSDWLVPAGFLLAAFLFDALVAPVVAGAGAVIKVMVTGVPILVVAAVVQLGRARVNAVIAAVACAVMFGYPLLSLAYNTRATVRHNNAVGQTVATLIRPLQAEQACLGRPVVLMTRQPWEDNQVTGVATVQLPYGPLSDILKAAQQYGVTDIEDPAVRPGVRDLTRLLADGGPFVRSTAFGSRKIYRLRSATSDARC